jgi:hypothetical protein
VEQAFALSVHDVDTVEKYDAEMESVSEASISTSAAIADDSWLLQLTLLLLPRAPLLAL